MNPEMVLKGRYPLVNEDYVSLLKRMHRGHIQENRPRGGFTLVHPAADRDPHFDGGSQYDFYFTPNRKQPGWYDVSHTSGYLILLQKEGEKMGVKVTRTSSQHLRAYGEVDPDVQEFYDFINANFVRFKSKRGRGGWWLPAHGLGINETMLGGINLWVWNILPYSPERSAYLPEGKAGPEEAPEGIVLRPFWVSHPKYNREIARTKDSAELLLKLAKQTAPVGDIVQRELKWIESKFGIKIPNSIKAKLTREAPKVAARRWGVNRVKTPNTFIPLDGRKPVPLRQFGPRYKKAACRVVDRYFDRLEGGAQ